MKVEACNMEMTLYRRLDQLAENIKVLADGLEDSDVDQDVIELMGISAIEQYNSLRTLAITRGYTVWNTYCVDRGFEIDHYAEDLVS